MAKRKELMDPGDGKTHAIRPGLRNLLTALGRSPAGSPWPRRGWYNGMERRQGTGRVVIPHLFGRPPTEETADLVEKGIGTGDTVIVYTQGC